MNMLCWCIVSHPLFALFRSHPRAPPSLTFQTFRPQKHLAIHL
jgi:hypothetical protein